MIYIIILLIDNNNHYEKSFSMNNMDINTSSQQNLTQKTNVYRQTINKQQNKACPIKLNIQYQYGQLQLSWDCTNLKCGQGTFLRTILLFDSQSYQNIDDIYQIAQIYYKRLKLGDFLKIVTSNRKIEHYWVQKTSQKLSKQDLVIKKQYNSNLENSIQSSLRCLKKFDQPGNISIFTRKSILEDNKTVKLLNQIKQKTNFCLLLAIFFQGQTKFQIRELRMLNIPSYKYKNQKQLEQKIKFFCNYQNKIRMTEAQIKLKCLNGDVYLKNPTPSSWNLTKSTLTKKLFALNNYTKYICPIQVNSFKIQKVGFELEFLITLVGGTKYKIQHTFYIKIQNPASSIQQARKRMHGQFKFINYSELPKQLRIQGCKVQKIMISQQYGEDEYLSYQRDFLNQ